MNISAIYIRRPVMTTLIWLGVVIFGAMAYNILPANDLPKMDFPTIMVNANLAGASPETMASSVATPLEREFATIDGLDSMNSQSGQGRTRITLQFNLDRDLDSAAQDVQSAINQTVRRLPKDMRTPPSLRKVNPAESPILYYSVNSAVMPLPQVHDYIDTFMAQRISMVQGVAQVSIYGAQKRAVRIQLDPRSLASMGLGLDEVAKAIDEGNVNLPTGILEGENQAFNVQSSGQLMDAAAYRPLLVAYRGGNPVRLEELGNVIDSVENDKMAAWLNDRRSMTVAVQRQPGTNTIAVVDAINEILPSILEQMPAAVQVELTWDRSQSIRESLHDVKLTLVLAITLVIMVVFLFLRNLSATIITSLAVPASIVGTFAIMYQLGFSLNNISLMALTLAVGFVVDDAIVMLENISRHRELGKSRMEAAQVGSKEIGFTVLSMTISLVAVFLPVFFMGGMLGRLFHEFAVTITAAILISGAVSLTLTPMLCSRFLKTHHEKAPGKIYIASERIFDAMLSWYKTGLIFVLNHRRATIVTLLIITLGTLYMFREIPKGFFPSEDRGFISGSTLAAQGTSFAAMSRYHEQATAIIRAHPEVRNVSSTVGTGGPNMSGNGGSIVIRLVPRNERKYSVDEFINLLRAELAVIPGLNIYMVNPPTINLSGIRTRSTYQFTLQSPNTDELYEHSQIMEERLRSLPMITDVNSDLQIKTPEVRVDLERDKAATLGVSAMQLEDTLYYAYGTREVSTIYASDNQYQVILELLPEFQMNPASLSLLYVRAMNNLLIPLDALAELRMSVGPQTVNHVGLLPAVTLSFNTAPGVALGDAVASVRALADQTLPDSISTSFEGMAKAFQSSQQGLVLLLIMAIVVIYLVLGILYESFIHPITILSGLPTAAFGALITLAVFGHDLNVYAFVGVIMLVGIMKKNAIMMIDFALEAQRRNPDISAKEAIYQGCLVRFRPIMMTTFAALMGVLPIALGYGAGGESRQPLGLAVAGGLLVSQSLTLFVTPVFYTYMESLRKKVSRKQGALAAPKGEALTEAAGR